MEYLYMKREGLSGPACSNWIRNKREEGKYRVKLWTYILVEILYTGSPQIKMGQKDLRKSEGLSTGER